MFALVSHLFMGTIVYVLIAVFRVCVGCRCKIIVNGEDMSNVFFHFFFLFF